MKPLFKITLVLSFFCIGQLGAQTADDLKNQIEAAKKALSEKNYKEVNFSLQQALSSLAVLVGNEVLAILPADINGMKPVKENDHVTNAGMMMAGTSIQREYKQGENNSVELNIIVNSPMVASLGMVLNNPMYTSSLGPNEKVISVNGKRGMLKMDKENKSAELQIVSGQNLITINANGMINSEADITAIANKIDFAKLDALLGY
jgi:hypothetical protein